MPPFWYMLITAARYLGVAPWELADKPMYWMRWALIAKNAEAIAEDLIVKQSRENR